MLAHPNLTHELAATTNSSTTPDSTTTPKTGSHPATAQSGIWKKAPLQTTLSFPKRTSPSLFEKQPRPPVQQSASVTSALSTARKPRRRDVGVPDESFTKQGGPAVGGVLAWLNGSGSRNSELVREGGKFTSVSPSSTSSASSSAPGHLSSNTMVASSNSLHEPVVSNRYNSAGATSKLPLPVPPSPTNGTFSTTAAGRTHTQTTTTPITRTNTSPTTTRMIEYRTITEHNIIRLKHLNSVVFPVSYNDNFYRDVLTVHPDHLSCMAYLNSQPIGAICCRKEPLYPPADPRHTPGTNRVYIMTLGVLSPYRRLHVGSALLTRIMDSVANDYSVQELALHVQTTNAQALAFYQRHGFVKVAHVKDYYSKNKGVLPPDAWALQRAFARDSMED